MKIKFLIPILLIALVFSLAGCIKNISSEITLPSDTQTVAIATTPNSAAPETSIPVSPVPKPTAPETSAIVTEPTISDDQFMEDYSTVLIESLNLNFGAELTEFAWDKNKTTIIIAYNSKNSTEATVKKEMYDITYRLADDGWFFNADLRLDATTDSGEKFQSITKLIDIRLGLSYNNWLKVAFGFGILNNQIDIENYLEKYFISYVPEKTGIILPSINVGNKSDLLMVDIYYVPSGISETDNKKDMYSIIEALYDHISSDFPFSLTLSSEDYENGYSSSFNMPEDAKKIKTFEDIEISKPGE